MSDSLSHLLVSFENNYFLGFLAGGDQHFHLIGLVDAVEIQELEAGKAAFRQRGHPGCAELRIAVDVRELCQKGIVPSGQHERFRIVLFLCQVLELGDRDQRDIAAAGILAPAHLRELCEQGKLLAVQEKPVVAVGLDDRGTGRTVLIFELEGALGDEEIADIPAAGCGDGAAETGDRRDIAEFVKHVVDSDGQPQILFLLGFVDERFIELLQEGRCQKIVGGFFVGHNEVDDGFLSGDRGHVEGCFAHHVLQAFVADELLHHRCQACLRAHAGPFALAEDAAVTHAGDRGRIHLFAQLLECLVVFLEAEIDEARDILNGFKWGHTFLELNHDLLESYSEANTSAEVVQIQNEFLESKSE